MKDALNKIEKASELFNERLSAVMSKDDEHLMKKLVKELDMRKLEPEDFEKMLCDLSASLTHPSEDV